LAGLQTAPRAHGPSPYKRFGRSPDRASHARPVSLQALWPVSRPRLATTPLPSRSHPTPPVDPATNTPPKRTATQLDRVRAPCAVDCPAHNPPWSSRTCRCRYPLGACPCCQNCRLRSVRRVP
jgi:hypothetical protein